MMAYLTMKQLLEAGVHFGHQTRRWNPKMKPYIFGARNGIYIIDLQQTVKMFKDAYDLVKDITSRGGRVLFVGTKRQAQGPVAEEATMCGMPYVNQRWIGGLLTNFATIRKSLKRFNELEKMKNEGDFATVTKKEALMMERERQRLEKSMGGMRNMEGLPSAIFVIDSKKDAIAIREARKLDMPVVAIVDTNCDPDEVDYVIPGNDDAIRAIKLFSSSIATACVEGSAIYQEGLQAASDKKEAPEKAAATEEVKEEVKEQTQPETPEKSQKTEKVNQEADKAPQG
jgi:small subunit ribosomal protein S2